MKLKGSLIYDSKVGQYHERDQNRETMDGNAGSKFPSRHIVKSFSVIVKFGSDRAPMHPRLAEIPIS